MTDEKTPVDHFLAWLIAMDDPEDKQGMRARQTVTLSYIIDRAREVKTWVELDHSDSAEESPYTDDEGDLNAAGQQYLDNIPARREQREAAHRLKH